MRHAQGTPCRSQRRLPDHLGEDSNDTCSLQPIRWGEEQNIPSWETLCLSEGFVLWISVREMNVSICFTLGMNGNQLERRILLEVAELREFTFLAKNKGFRRILFPLENGNAQDLHFTFK